MAALMAVVWVFLAFAGGSGEDERAQEADGSSTSTAAAPTTTTQRGSTTTTTEVLQGWPLLGEATDLELVAVGGTSRIIDLDTGGVTVVRARVLGATDHGLLVEDRDGVAVWPPPYDGSNATAMLPANTDTVIDQVWVVGDGTLVWAVERAGGQAVTALTSTLVDLDGDALGRFEVPGEFWPVGATDHGLVVAGPGGLYLIDAAGDAERVSTGSPVGVLGDRIYASNCDEDLFCHLEVLDEGGRFVEERPSQVANNIVWATEAPDGRVALIEYNAHLGEPNRVTIDGVTVYEDYFEITGSGGMGGIAWSPDGRWLAIAVADGVHFFDTVGGVGERVVDVGLLGQPGHLLFVALDG